MLIIKKKECLMAMLMINQAGAFIGYKSVAANTLCDSTVTDSFPSALMSKQLSLVPISNKRHMNTCLDSTASVGPLTESSSQEQNSLDKESKPKTEGAQKKTITSTYNGKKRKPRRNNPAMGDTAFLRKRTADLLRTTDKNNHNDIARGMKVKIKTFHFLIDSWAFSGELDASDQALTLLDRMEELQDANSPSNVRPDVRSYTKVINAVSRSMRPDAGDIAEAILDKMENLYTSGVNIAAKPNTFTYTAVIEAYTNSGADGAAEKSEQLLDIMIQKYENGDEDVRPASRSFNAVINAYGKSGYPGAANQAEYLFHRLENLYMSGIAECKPNTFNYNSLIGAFANSAEEGSAERAASLLNQMEQNYKSGDADCKPTTVTFNAVINAFAKSGQEDGAQRAEEILLHMEKVYESGEDVKPNTRSFNSVINAWAKSPREDGAQHAQDLFDFMNGLYQNAANKSLRPDVHTFCTVINAWGRSQDQGKAEHANNLFNTMIKAYQEGNKNLKPNIVVFNSVINACAYTYGGVDEQQRAMEIAHNQLKLLESTEYASPDHLTYGTFLKVCANQMEDCETRRQIMEVIFKKCINDGQLGNLVLQQIRDMGPPETYKKLLGRDIDEEVKMEDFPKKWHSNVVEGKWRRRRNH